MIKEKGEERGKKREERSCHVPSCVDLQYTRNKKEVGGSDRKQIENYPMSV